MDNWNCNVKLVVGQQTDNPTGKVEFHMKSGGNYDPHSRELVGRDLTDLHTYIVIPHCSEEAAGELAEAITHLSVNDMLREAIGIGEFTHQTFTNETNCVVELQGNNEKLEEIYRLIDEEGKLDNEQELNLEVDFGTNLELSLNSDNTLLALLYSLVLRLDAKLSSDYSNVLRLVSENSAFSSIAELLPFMKNMELDLQLDGPAELPTRIKQHISSTLSVNFSEKLSNFASKFPGLKDSLIEKSKGEVSLFFKAKNLSISVFASFPNLSAFFNSN